MNEAVRLATEPLVNDQIEWHPFVDQSATRKACHKHGLSVTAYSPVAKGRAANNKTLAAIGDRHGKTATQVALRFLLQEGAIVIPLDVSFRAAGGKSRRVRFHAQRCGDTEVRKLAR